MFKADYATACDLLAHLVAFDTVSRNPNRALIEFIRDYLDGHGITSEIVAGAEDGKACLWATVGDAREKGVMLSGHTDVVPIDDQRWDSDPFKLTDRGDNLYARGAADMKGFIACALAFVPEFLAASARGCFHLALTCDEETDMSGALRLKDFLWQRKMQPTWVWVGEPTNLSIVTQHKGVSAYRTRFTGIPGHSSQPDKGLNAIGLATRFIDVIDQAAHTRRHSPFVPSAFDPPYSTFNLGTIAGGTAENIIAETCELVWQIRAHPGETARQILTEVTQKAQTALTSSLAPFMPRAGMETMTCFDIPPFRAAADNEGEKVLKKALQCTHTHAVGFATEAGIFQQLGAAGVICGPGAIEQAHQPNEYIDKNQLVGCVDLMRHVLLSSSPAKQNR